jgi:hypothetical protein
MTFSLRRRIAQAGWTLRLSRYLDDQAGWNPMNSARIFLVLAVGFAPAVAVAADITGIWATDASLCAKIFKKQGTSISFQDDSDLYGNGFVIDANRIRGKGVQCAIKSQKIDGPIVHIIASCATDIMLSTVPFSLKIISDDSISRVYPKSPELEQPYYRCRL